MRDFIRVELVYLDEEAFLQGFLLSVHIIYRSSSGFIFLLLGDPVVLCNTWDSFGSILLAGDLLGVWCVLMSLSQSHYSSWDLDP